MGAAHVSKVFAYWSTLQDRPFRLLCHMALVAKDAHTKPRYFGGRDALAMSLGMDPDVKSSHRMVATAMQKLVDAGAVVRDPNTGFRGRRQEYLLTLERVTPQSPIVTEERVTEESPITAEKGDSRVRERVTPESERVTPESTKGDSRVTPRNTEEGLGATKRKKSHLTQPSTEGPGAGSEITEIQARRIIREHTNGDTRERDRLRNLAPLGQSEAQRQMWIARHILSMNQGESA